MKRLLKLLLIMVLPSLLLAVEQKKGSVSVLLFSEGKPLVSNEIKFDGQKIFKTDKDGSIQVPLIVGKHQIEIFGKDAAGAHLGYFKKQITIKEGKDTQVIATLSKTGADNIDIDTPVAMRAVKDKDVKRSTGTGRLSGTVLSSERGKPISGARVFVRGTAIDTRTDAKGRFFAKVPSGIKLSISVVHSAYSAQTIGNIRVSKDGSTSRTIKLTPASMELEEFVVLAPKIEGSIASVIAEEKKSSAIANILGSEDISKKGDSSAAAALKRVTGITLVGGKNIYVRGLGERYSNIEMNSLPIPSPDPTKRTVPLDIFPSSVIGSMKIQKSGSADIPSSFGGGYIDIRTKDSSKDSFIKISLGVEGNSNTGKTSQDYFGSESDFLGYDNGYRAIVNYILDAAEVKVGERVKAFTTDYFTEEELSQMTIDYVDRNYQIQDVTLPLGFGGSIEVADNYKFGDDHTLSVSGNYGYSQKHTFVEESFFGYDMGSDGELHTDPDYYGTNSKSVSTFSHGGSLNIGYNFADVLKLKYTKLYTRDAQKSTRIVDGIIGSNYDHLFKYYLDWEERVLDVDQINGEFDYEIFNKKSELQFGFEKANANLYQPNNFHYAYIEERDVTHVDNTISNHLANNLTSNDDVLAMYLRNKLYMNIFSEDDYVDVGMKISSKERTSRQNKFFLRKIGGSGVDDFDLTGDIEEIYYEYVRNDIPYDDRAFIVSPLFKPADYFDAYVDESNYYANVFLKPLETFEVMAGLRYVDFKQTIYQYQEDSDNPDMDLRRLIQRIPEQLEVQSFYPSVSVKYKYDDNNHFDFAASKTFIVPDLREFTSGEYFHPYDVATVLGNPELVNTDIYSLDLKYSHYFSETENVKFGLFFKYLDKPIEDVMLPSSSLPIYSYDNADSALLYGIEIDGRKKLDFLHHKLYNYYVAGNFSYTDSDVTLREEQEVTFSTNHRQLQGLSQTVVNLSLGYDIKDRSVSLSYNKMGERIRKVGLIDAGDVYPDHYEIPPHLLDFVWIEKLGNGMGIKAKLGNLLDNETVWTQGDNITKQFKKGRTFSFGASYQY